MADQREAQVSAQSPPDPEKERQEKLRQFLKLAQDRFRLAEEAESENRRSWLDDMKFRIGEQWPADIQTARNADGRPCLTMNRLPQFIRQVTNEQRQQRPSIQVNPAGDGSDIDTAEVIQGIIRHIEVMSDAEVAYDTAFDHMVTGGFGFFRVVTEYVDDKSLDQEIKIKRIKNPCRVYFDPSALEPDYSDADWCLVVEDMPASEYKQEYGDSAAASLSDFSSVGDNAPGWAQKDTIRVAEYWRVEMTASRLFQFDNGEVIDEANLGKDPASGALIPPIDDLGQPRQIKASRQVKKRQILFSKINAIEELEAQKWPGAFIPIIPVLGDDLDINGKRHLSGLVRSAKDPQRMYNYWVSAGTEMIALAPRAPFVGAEGQFAGHEAKWGEANTRNLAYLEYKPVSVGGSPAAPPQRQTFEPPVQAINLMTRQADGDLKATTGINSATLGDNESEKSGKAILLRQKQSDISTLNFSDNLARSIRHCGRTLIDLIPHVYDAPRIQRIIKPDQSVDHVGVFNSKKSGMGQQDAESLLLSESIKKVFDIGVGRYDVTVSVGPSYQSKRQESVAAQMALVGAYPNMVPIVGDIMVGNMDWPGAKEMAKRLKKMLPPQLQDEGNDDPEQQAQKLQSQLQQLMQQHEIMTKALNDANQVITQKRIESDSKLSIVKLQEENKLAIAEITTKAQEAKIRAETTAEIWKELHSSAHELGMQSEQHGHEQDLAEQSQQAASEQSAQDAAQTQAAQPENDAAQ